MIFNSDPGHVADTLNPRVRKPVIHPKRSALLVNDRNYFRAAATTTTFGGCKIVRVDSLPQLTAACVVECESPNLSDLRRVWAQLANFKIDEFRTYLYGKQRVDLFEQIGCAREIEVAYHMQVDQASPARVPPNIKVRDLTRADDPIKISLLDEDSARPDGKASHARDYVELERLKIEAGYMKGFMIEVDDEPAGFFSLSIQNDLVRMKNLFSAPRMRGQGCGAAIIAFAREFGRKNGKQHLGVFAIEGGAGERLYARNGMKAIGAQTEYSAKIDTLMELPK